MIVEVVNEQGECLKIIVSVGHYLPLLAVNNDVLQQINSLATFIVKTPQRNVVLGAVSSGFQPWFSLFSTAHFGRLPYLTHPLQVLELMS